MGEREAGLAAPAVTHLEASPGCIQASRCVASMMIPHSRLFSWIGLLGSLVGLWLLYNPPDEGALPVNQVLVALDGGLVVVWGLIFLAFGRG